MNIKILDSWLREYVKTSATTDKIGELLSLSSVGVERIEKYNKDFVYDIEVTTNRPELMSVVGIAREVATVLPQNDIKATFVEPNFKIVIPSTSTSLSINSVEGSPQQRNSGEKIPPRASLGRDDIPITIKNDPKLVKRYVAVILEVTIKDSPQYVKDRLESSGIRSLNNVIDITNYVMREIGHPTHVFDYDRLTNHTLIIRESKKGEKLTTLDNKTYALSGGDVVADNGTGEIVDLLGVMGTANSVVTKDTKRIVFFIESVDPVHIRKTSMEYGIRTEAAVINEKGPNPEYISDALARGIALFEKLADGKIISKIVSDYPNPPKQTTITLTKEKMDAVIGVPLSLKTATQMLATLGFIVKEEKDKLIVTVPAKKAGDDMQIPEDLIEEIARVYGYHNIPNSLPPITNKQTVHLESNELYWEDRIKDALKYWGFTEVYTYPMVSKELITGKPEEAVTIHNPLNEEFVYMRQTLIPSLVQVADNNPDHEVIKIFEIANVYEKNANSVPHQNMRLSGLVRKPKNSFYDVKGIIEQLLDDVGITGLEFKPLENGRSGAEVFIRVRHSGEERLQNLKTADRSNVRDSGQARMTDNGELGVIEILDETTIDFEIDLGKLLQHVKQKRLYIPPSKYPPIVEDIAIIAPVSVLTGDLISAIKKQSSLIVDVSLLDKYQETRTFHIVYQSTSKNLTNEDVKAVREKIIQTLKNNFQARLKG